MRIVPGAPISLPSGHEPRAFAISTSGGASLGAYEAGYLFYVSEVLKRNPGATTLRVLTGASAGAINSVLLAFSYCSEPIARPEESVLYRVWHRPTLRELYRPLEVSSTAMLSRSVLWEAAREVEARVAHGLPTSCDLLLGIPTTRLDPIQVPVPGGNTTVPRIAESFSLRLRGRGPGVLPSLENYVDREHGYGISLLPIDGDSGNELDALFDLAFASSAFPVAFSPVDLPHCVRNLEGESDGACTPETATHARFIDGGVLENQPLSLAAKLLRTGIEPSTRRLSVTRVRDRPSSDATFLPDRLYVVAMDPRGYAFDGLEEETPPVSPTVLGLGASVARSFMSGARAMEVLNLVENHPEVRDSLRVTTVFHPPIGSLLSDFFGLVDRKLVDFDFVLGMYDARKELLDITLPRLAREVGRDTLEVALPDGPAESSPVWREFACLRSMLGGEGDPSVACGGDDLRSFRAALQVTIERLYSACAVSHPERIDPTHSSCLAARRGDPPPVVPGVPAVRAWQFPRSEDPTRRAIERLGKYGFHFEDLGLGPEEGDRAIVELRALLGRAVSSFAAAQPSYREVVDIALTLGLNEFAYQPRRMIGHLVLSLAPEVGISWTRPNGRAPFLRAAFAMSFDGLQASVGLHEVFFAVAPQLGLEIEPVRVSNGRIQLRFGARLGYAISTFDHAGRDTCPGDPTRQVRCSRAIVNTYVAVSIVGLFRLQLAFALRPAWGQDEQFVWSILPGFGLQFHSRR